MEVTRRLVIAGGLAAGLPGVAWAAPDDAPTKMVISKTGHILLPTMLGGEECFGLLDNTQSITAVSFDAPGLDSSQRLDISLAGKDAVFVRLARHLRPAFGGLKVEIDTARRGLQSYTRANGVPVSFVIGAALFEQAVVELDFMAGTLKASSPKGFKDPENARVFESKSKTPGQFLVPIEIGDDVKTSAAISLGYPGVILISHPKVGEWLNDGREVSRQESTLVFGNTSTKQEQVAFTSPRVKLGPYILGEVRAVADSNRDDGIGATLGVTALRPFRVWLDGSRGRVWLKVNTA